MFTKVWIFCQLNTKNLSRALTVFRVFLTRPRSSLNIIFKPIIIKAKLIELLIFYCIWKTRKIFELRILEFFTNCNQRCFCIKVFFCAIYVFFLLLQFWKYVLEKNVLAQNQDKNAWWARRILRKLCITKTCSTFLRLSELSRLATLVLKTWEIVAREKH